MKYISLLLLLLVFLMSGCLGAGTWEDDPRNWERAFGQRQPEGIKVVHSRYTQTPHFTHESQCFFEIAPNEELRKEMTDPETVLEIPPEERDKHFRLRMVFSDHPSWFAPKDPGAYNIYVGKTPRNNYFLFVDKASGAMFITESIGM